MHPEERSKSSRKPAKVPQKRLRYKRHDTPGTHKAFLVLAIIAAIIMLWLNLNVAQAQQWPAEPTVSYDRTNEPVDATQAIEYALWSIRERTGRSGSIVPLGGDIPITWVSAAQMLNQTQCSCNGWAWWSWDQNSNMTSASILLNIDTLAEGGKKLVRTVLHELGHALGGDIHHNEAGAVLSASGRYPYDYALTTTDALKLPYASRSLCFAELTLQNDIYIPDIQGMKAMLRYQGDGVWALVSLAENESTQGCTQASVNEAMEIELTDLRGYSGQYSYVRLEPIGNDTWALGMAIEH